MVMIRGGRQAFVWFRFVPLVLAACGVEPSEGNAPSDPSSRLPPGVEAPRNASGETAELMALGLVGPCSGTLIDVGGAPDEPAYALTGGHCLGEERWLPNGSLVDLPSDHVPTFQANTFWDTLDERIDFSVARVEYQSMHRVDVAILRLEATNAEVFALGVAPLKLAEEAPLSGDNVAIVGNPYLESLRVSRCKSGESTYLAEDEFLFRATRAPCAGIAPGSSGSSVLNDANEVVGVLLTSSGSGRPCSLDSPCDLSESGLVNSAEKMSYFSDLVPLNACFVGGRFHLEAPDCPLPQQTQIVARRGIGRYVSSRSGSVATWSVSLAGSESSHYRFKTGDARTTRCDDERGYGAVRSVAELPTIDEAVPQTEGLYSMCVQGGGRTSFEPILSAVNLFAEVDNTPPNEPFEPGAVQILPGDPTTVLLQPTTIEVSKIYYRLQLKGQTDCSLAASDSVALSVTEFSIGADDPRRELCATVEDAAGNRTAPALFEL